MTHQHNYSLIDPLMLNGDDRRKKAQKIILILQDYFHKHKKVLKKVRCLELGCSAGGMTVEFARYVDSVTALDIDTHGLNLAKTKRKRKNIAYQYGDVLALPFDDQSFDLVIANHVYEHIQNSQKMIAEIYRVLTKKGICYFAGPQKFTLIEPHYHLPFLSWLPKSFSAFFVRLAGRGTSYYETPLAPGQLRTLVNKFTIADYTIRVIKDPKRYKTTYALSGLVSRIPQFILQALYPFLPSFFWVLEKR